MPDNYPIYAIHAANDEVSRHLSTALRLCESGERGLDLIRRLSDQFKLEDSIPTEVLEYIDAYEVTCGELGLVPIVVDVGTEGVLSTIKNICISIWNMILRLWDKIKACFRWLFNAQYRASREAIRCSQQIAQLRANKDASAQFLNYEVDAMLAPDDLDKYLIATDKLIDMLKRVAEIGDLEQLNVMITKSVGECGLTFKDNEFGDVYGEPPYKRGTYSSIGWKSVDDIFEMSKRNVEIMRKTVVLKNLESELSRDVEALKRKQNNKVADGEDVTAISEELNLKLKQYKLILAGQNALMERIEVLSEEFAAIAEDAYDVENGTYKDDEDD